MVFLNHVGLNVYRREEIEQDGRELINKDSGRGDDAMLFGGYRTLIIGMGGDFTTTTSN